MTPHLTDAQLRRFLEGTLPEAEAVPLALHLDACPACETRAAALDPVGPLLAILPDPALPAGFCAEVLERAEAGPLPLHPEGVRGTGIIATVLLGLALLLLVLSGDLPAVATSLVVRLGGLAVALRTLAGLLAPSLLLPVLAALALAASAAAVRLLHLARDDA